MGIFYFIKKEITTMFVTNAERRRYLAFELRRMSKLLGIDNGEWDRYVEYIMNTDKPPKRFLVWVLDDAGLDLPLPQME